jgi:hypothetical protein
MSTSATTKNGTSPECHRSRTNDQKEQFGHEQGGSLRAGPGDGSTRSTETNCRQKHGVQQLEPASRPPPSLIPAPLVSMGTVVCLDFCLIFLLLHFSLHIHFVLHLALMLQKCLRGWHYCQEWEFLKCKPIWWNKYNKQIRVLLSFYSVSQ